MARHVGIVGLGAYPLLAGASPSAVLGPDVYHSLLARGLQARDFQVSVITYEDGSGGAGNLSGIRVIKACAVKSPAVRVCLSLGGALRRAGADVYIQQGTAGLNPVVCRLMRRPFVFSVGSDWYVDRTSPIPGFGRVSRLVSDLTIRLADAIIVQTGTQQQALSKNYHRESTLIRPCFPLTERGMPDKAEPPVALWVGSMAAVKQPALFARLAEEMPEVRFRMVAGPGSREVQEDVKRRARRCPNLELRDTIPLDEIGAQFRQAAVLVNTSLFEGFPYAFLQAWMSYTPVVSLNADPDGILRRHGIGSRSGSFEDMVKDLRGLIGDSSLRREMGLKAREYVEREHGLEQFIGRHAELFDRLTKK
ncbi:MAG: glycosyltransferase family 4 protein [Chloroflexi bacterium]|nr:glycosyltransferase family 4 protein [Chloroflexota bacterium]